MLRPAFLLSRPVLSSTLALSCFSALSQDTRTVLERQTAETLAHAHQALGSVGVSGGNEDQDEACAQAGVDAVQGALL